MYCNKSITKLLFYVTFTCYLFLLELILKFSFSLKRHLIDITHSLHEHQDPQNYL